MRVFVYNQKGGVGQTTTVINLAAGLLRAGVGSVTVADFDPERHLTAGLGCSEGPFDWTVDSWLDGVPGSPLVISDEPGLYLIPGTDTPQDQTGDVYGLMTEGGAWLVMDAPCAWTPRHSGLMRGSDLILCPLEPDFAGMQGVNALLRHMNEAGISLDRLRLLLTRYNSRLVVHREVRARLRERFGDDIVLNVPIRNSARLTDQTGEGISVFANAPKSVGAHDYLALARLIAGRPMSQSSKRRPRV